MEKPKYKLKNDETDADIALQFALNFSPEDIDSNRDGHLSPSQREAFAVRETRWMGIAILSALVIIWSVMNAAGRIDVAIGQGNIGWFIVAGISAYGWFKWKQLYDDLHTQEIGSAQGLVDLEIVGNNKNSSLKLRLQDMQFTVQKNIFLAFKNGDPYAIYYAPHSKTILSAEWLREG